MEDTWLCIEEDSSDHSFSDSDVIDSETEAELYSLIHYKENLSNLDCNVSGVDTVQNSEVPVLTTDKVNNVFCTEKNRESINIKSVVSLMNVSQNDVNSVVDRKFPCQTKFLSKLEQKLNPVRKEKSNFDLELSTDLYSDNSNSNQSFMDASLNNKLKRKIDHYSKKNQNSTKKSKVLFDSSDSDSIIWTEGDSSGKKDFQTNLCEDEDTVCIGSDSESDILHVSKTRAAHFRNLSMPNIKIGEKSKDIWFIKDADLVRQKRSKSTRYHDNAEISCSNCNRKGHNSSICPMPKSIKCCICGGDHISDACANRICGRCYRFGHGSKRCWMPCVNYCTLCSMKGHFKQNCPDIWRRYNLTTQLGKIIHGRQFKQKKYPCCWNCGEIGHYGAVCKQYRVPKDCLPTWPGVVTYDDPEDILRMIMNGYCGRRGNFSKDEYSNQINKPNEACNLLEQGKKKKKKNKLNLQHFKNLKALREKDFPRTPKNNSHSNLSDDYVPESVSNFLSNKLKRKEKKRKRRLKKKLQILMKKASGHSLQANT